MDQKTYKIYHPLSRSMAIRPHPNSPLYQLTCWSHGSACTVNNVHFHHFPGSWTSEQRKAHPEWARDLRNNCSDLPEHHVCDDVCELFRDVAQYPEVSSNIDVSPSNIHDDILYLHASKRWDDHWKNDVDFSLETSIARYLSPEHCELARGHLHKVGECYQEMQEAKHFDKISAFFLSVFHNGETPGHDEPRFPLCAFGAGFGGFDKMGYERAGFRFREPGNLTVGGERSRFQIALFVAMCRILQIPAGYMLAYDPCYTDIDIAILASVGVHAYGGRRNPELRSLTPFTVPTLFYAPGAEQMVYQLALKKGDPIQNLILLGGDAEFCDDIKYFLDSRHMKEAPQYFRPTSAGPRSCGVDHEYLQWVPEANVETYKAAVSREEPISVSYVLMLDGSEQLDEPFI